MFTNKLAKGMKSLVVTLSCSIPALSLAQGLNIATGANLVVNGNTNLIVKDGGFNNNGTFIPGTGTVTLTGTAAPTISLLGGTSSLSFYNLGINKTAGSAKLAKNIAITNTLLMQQANLDLSTFNIDLGTTGSISGESATSAITGASGGTVLRTVNLNAPSAISPGNMGIEITSSANLGLTTIKRGNQQQVNSSGYSINRYFEITPTNNTALNATIKFNYFDAELASINEGELKIWSSANNGSSWTLLGADAQDLTNNFVVKNGIGQLNRFTLASSVTNPLPVRFLSFNGQVVGNNVALSWVTGYELNNHHFEIEKSSDGKNFTSVIKTPASSVTTGASYQATDFNAFSANAVYYRIKQVNIDGSFSYTKVIAFNKSIFDNKLIAVYPNPASGPIQVRFTSSTIKQVMLQVIDGRGNVVATKALITRIGLNEVGHDVSQLAQGVYVLRLLGIEDNGINIIKN